MIRIVELYKAFGTQEVLRGVNLTIPSQQITTLMGCSGCGKSVLLKHIIGLLKPDRGSILLDGIDITKLRGRALNKVRERFSMLFQSAALFDSLTVFENVAFPLREKTHLSEETIAKQVEEKLEQVGLSGMENKYPAELSGGMKKRVGLARALITNPEIILFDEPTAGLDPVMGRTIHQLIYDTWEQIGFTAVIVSHEVPEVFEISHYVAMLYSGVIVESGPTAAIRNSTNPVVRQFIDGSLAGPIEA
ncbi:MAG: ABC transporter ATP-binding protein [Nitrospinota bacterium]|nr:MAG: ABC transporter ATP-binding protein [Nitrospinota bacterium]